MLNNIEWCWIHLAGTSQVAENKQTNPFNNLHLIPVDQAALLHLEPQECPVKKDISMHILLTVLYIFLMVQLGRMCFKIN